MTRSRSRSVVGLLVGLLVLAMGAGLPCGSGIGDAAAALAPGTHTVTVTGGYGSGTYPVGATVHVWSAVSTAAGVAEPWTGDAALLDAPKEWHTTFVMPDRDVHLNAVSSPQLLRLDVETYTGTTTLPKTVRFSFPPQMRGVVLFNHGTGGNSGFIEGNEANPVALALVAQGYGVVSTEAEEVVAGDLNGDGKQRWSSRPAVDNVDLGNLEVLFDSFESRGLIPSGTPKFALGMSAGGAFSHFLGTLGATPWAPSFPQLQFHAVVGYCADASSTRSSTTSITPSAWYLCGADDNSEVSNDEAIANEATLRARGIPTDLLVHPPSPLYDGRFTRIPGTDLATSTAMAGELRTAGFVDAAGFLTVDSDAISLAILTGPTTFPTLSSRGLAAVRSQLKAMRAEHSMYADATARTVDFFERFNPNTPPVASGYHALSPTRVLDSRGPTGGWNGPLSSAGPRDVAVTEQGGPSNVPASASAVVLNVTATGGTAGSFLTVHPAWTVRPNASNLNFAAGQTIANLVTVKLGPGGAVRFTNAIGTVDVVADIVGYYDGGSGPGDLFTGITPTRVLDSRGPTGGWPGPLAAGAPRDLTVRQPGNASGVPATATAVIANVTVTGGTAGSFVSVWPAGEAQPEVSNLNFAPGQTIPNLAIVKIGTGGAVRLANAVGSVHVVVDVVGYFDPTAGARFHAVLSTRVLDDRTGTGLSGPWGPGQTRALPVGGAAGTRVPAGATGIVANVTATGGTEATFVTVFPDGVATPTSSSLNVGVGETIPNLVTVKLPANGQVDLFNQRGRLDLVADVVGYYWPA